MAPAHRRRNNQARMKDLSRNKTLLCSGASVVALQWSLKWCFVVIHFLQEIRAKHFSFTPEWCHLVEMLNF